MKESADFFKITEDKVMTVNIDSLETYSLNYKSLMSDDKQYPRTKSKTQHLNAVYRGLFVN